MFNLQIIKTKLNKQLANGNLLYIILIVVLLIALFPFLYLIRYNMPGASDDILHAFYLSEMPYLDSVFLWYKSGFNGRYANSVIMLMPGRPFINVWFAQTIPYLTFSFLFFSILFLIRSFNKEFSIKNSILVSLSIFAFFIGYSPSVHEFYWFAGTSVYIIPTIIYFLLLGTLLRFFNKSNNVLFIISIIIELFFIIGSHETWMLYGAFTVFGFSLFELLNKRKLKLSSYIIIVWSLVLVGLFVFAPGNSVRINNEGSVVKNADFLGSAILSFFDSFNMIKTWFLNLGFFLIILAGLIFPKNSNAEKASLAKTSLIIVLSFFTVFISVFVVKYSLGHLSELRLRGIIPGFILASLLVFYLVYNLKLGFLEKVIQPNINLSYGFLLAGIVYYSASSKNVANAYIDIFSERAKIESSQVLWVQNYIKNSKEEVLYIPNVNKGTKTLLFMTIPKEGSWYHWSLKSYYKKSIILDEKLNFDNFLFLHDSIETVKLVINPENNFVNGVEFSNETVRQNKSKKLNIKAVFDNPSNIISNDNKIVMVIQCGDYWKGISIIEIVKNGKDGYVNINENLPEKLSEKDNLKVYFWNKYQDSLVVSKFKVSFE